jgi:hypothetical protein
MRYRDVDPKIKRFFPWSLFLIAALFFVLASVVVGHSEEDVWACYGGGRYQAMSSGWPQCNEMSTLCLKVREYLNTHTEEEGRAEAVAKHIPQWLIAKAERCVPK